MIQRIRLLLASRSSVPPELIKELMDEHERLLAAQRQDRFVIADLESRLRMASSQLRMSQLDQQKLREQQQQQEHATRQQQALLAPVRRYS